MKERRKIKNFRKGDFINDLYIKRRLTMIKKFLVLTISMFLFSTGYVFAGVGHDHGGHDKGSSHETSKTKKFSADAVEVGNKICPVSKQNVEEMGGAIQYEYEGKIYNLCCKMCLKDFKKNPEKYIQIIDKMMESQQEEGANPNDSHGGHNH